MSRLSNGAWAPAPAQVLGVITLTEQGASAE